MTKKKILSVGFELASDDVEYGDYNKDISLLDWDIILFQPANSFYSDNHFQGKPSLSDRDSFKAKERAEHWRRQINEAMVNGKTVIIFLTELNDFYIDTGERTYSGTGRNQKTTRHVALYDNYQSIPIGLLPVKAKGKEIKVDPNNAAIISSYWQGFSKSSNYMVTISNDKITPLLLTKTGNKIVGGFYKLPNLAGSLLFLPEINFEQTDFYTKKGEWSKIAIQFAGELVKAVVLLNKFMMEFGETTPEPDWAQSSQYLLDKEIGINQNLFEIEQQFSNIQRQKEKFLEELRSAGQIRGLLYEKGTTLEQAIIEALNLLSFKTSQFKDDKSEFDVVFESLEGRLLGEAEGKDNQAINIDKLRQLSMNIHEDLMRDEIELPAKGVLFGNAYRLKPLNERQEPFTTKCLANAATSSVALIFTPDLFHIALYLSNNIDMEFASKCRETIYHTNGRVTFPDIPSSKTNLNETQSIKN